MHPAHPSLSDFASALQVSARLLPTVHLELKDLCHYGRTAGLSGNSTRCWRHIVLSLSRAAILLCMILRQFWTVSFLRQDGRSLGEQDVWLTAEFAAPGADRDICNCSLSCHPPAFLLRQDGKSLGEQDALLAAEFAAADADRDGRVTFDEFASYLPTVSTNKARQQLRAALGVEVESEWLHRHKCYELQIAVVIQFD